MPREISVSEQELYSLIMEYVVGNGITLEGFDAVVRMVKKEYGKMVIQ